MDYNLLLELATDLGYELAMCGAETFRVEESVRRVLLSYGIHSEVFAITNCLTVSIETDIGKPMTRMRRIGIHGNDLNAVEQLSNLSRKICQQTPPPQEARRWLEETRHNNRSYGLPWILLGHFLGSFGFSIMFGGSLMDGVCGGLAEYLNIDVVLIRLIWALVTLCTVGVGLIGYLIAAIIMPRKSEVIDTTPTE